MLITLVAAMTYAQAAPRTFDCVETSVVRPMYQQAVQFHVDSNDRVNAGRVTRVMTGAVEIESRNVRYAPNYDQGYWLAQYGLEAWYLGQLNGSRFLLMVPAGGLGGQVDVEVHQYFQVGGWWQSEFHCTVR